MPGSGLGGRLTKEDLLGYLKQKKESPAQTPTDSEDEIVEMDRMRQIIAERMVNSVRISPHVTSFVEADVTHMYDWCAEQKKPFYQKHQISLTLTPLFLMCVLQAIQQHPEVNVSVEGTRIIRHKAIHLGVAIALDNGNLIVPVIHHAEELNLLGLVKKTYALVQDAKNNRLTPDALSKGTYTVSNIGSFGNLMGTPIILQPQCAIMAIGVVRKVPAVIETPHGDAIAIRKRLFLSHSYDHRVIDGAKGGMFAKQVALNIEKFDPEQKS